MNDDAKLVMYCVTALILIAPFAFWAALYTAVLIRRSIPANAVALIGILLPSGWIAALLLVILYFAGTLRLDAWPLAAALAVSSAVLLLPGAWLRARMVTTLQPIPEPHTAPEAGETTEPKLQEKAQQAIIRTPRVALVILIAAACFAASKLWHLTLGPQPRANWIYPLNSFLPNWAAVAMNVFTYGLFALLLIEILRDHRGAERTLLAICFAEVLIVPARRYAPGPISTVIVFVQAFGALIMFLAAVQLFLRTRKGAREPRGSGANE